MPRNDYADAYSDPGMSPASSTGACNLDWEWWNNMPNGGDLGDDFIADPKNTLVKNWASVRRNAWGNKIQIIKDRLDQFKKWARHADCCICPEWLIAIWWDERARMGAGEQEMDNIADGLGMDTSTGPFQMKGSAAVSTIAFSGKYHAKYTAMDGDELQDEMQENFDLAAALAADRMCQIMAGYKSAGWNPCTQGKISAIELIGTLYSQGLGSPKPNPEANDRGKQIAAWSHQAAKLFELEDCNCECNLKAREAYLANLKKERTGKSKIKKKASIKLENKTSKG